MFIMSLINNAFDEKKENTLVNSNYVSKPGGSLLHQAASVKEDVSGSSPLDLKTINCRSQRYKHGITTQLNIFSPCETVFSSNCVEHIPFPHLSFKLSFLSGSQVWFSISRARQRLVSIWRKHLDLLAGFSISNPDNSGDF